MGQSGRQPSGSRLSKTIVSKSFPELSVIGMLFAFWFTDQNVAVH
jgi:hypothetical protein